jgi:hypothetical protein
MTGVGASPATINGASSSKSRRKKKNHNIRLPDLSLHGRRTSREHGEKDFVRVATHLRGCRRAATARARFGEEPSFVQRAPQRRFSERWRCQVRYGLLEERILPADPESRPVSRGCVPSLGFRVSSEQYISNASRFFTQQPGSSSVDFFFQPP